MEAAWGPVVRQGLASYERSRQLWEVARREAARRGWPCEGGVLSEAGLRYAVLGPAEELVYLWTGPPGPVSVLLERDTGRVLAARLGRPLLRRGWMRWRPLLQRVLPPVVAGLVWAADKLRRAAGAAGNGGAARIGYR